MNSHVRWIPGEHHALVWQDAAVLLDADVSADLVEAVWHSFGDSGDPARFIDLLAGSLGVGVLNLPPFAGVFQRPEGGALVVARGAFSVSRGAEGIVDGSSASTWRETEVAALDGVCITAAEVGEGPSRPLIAGVVSAGALTWRSVDATEPAEPAASVEPAEPAESAERAEPVAAVESAEPAEVATPAERVSSLAAEAVDSAPARPIVETLADSDLAEMAVDSAPEIASESPADMAAAPSPEPAADGSEYAELWGPTTVAPVEQAAVRPAEEPTLLIDAVPSATPAAPGRTPTEPIAAQDDPWADRENTWDADDHDGFTVMNADLRPATPHTPPPSAPSADLLVLGVRCTNGHPNSPQSTRCWQCGAPVTGVTERLPKPIIGLLRTSEGELIELQGTVVFGRKPRSPRATGVDLPKLVQLPYAHVSSTHLQIEVQGWSALAVDQRSTNGTFLRRRDDPPTRLPDAPVPLVSGDVLDLGHGVFVTVEKLA